MTDDDTYDYRSWIITPQELHDLCGQYSLPPVRVMKLLFEVYPSLVDRYERLAGLATDSGGDTVALLDDDEDQP